MSNTLGTVVLSKPELLPVACNEKMAAGSNDVRYDATRRPAGLLAHSVTGGHAVVDRWLALRAAHTMLAPR